MSNKVLNNGTRVQDGTCNTRYTAGDLEHWSHSALVLRTLPQDFVEKADKWRRDSKTNEINPFIETYHVSCFCSVFCISVLT